MKLSRLLRTTRESQKVTLTDLARRARVSTGYLSRIERGERSRQPSEKLLLRLASALAIPADRILVSAGRLPKDVRVFLLSNPNALDSVREMMRAA